MEEFLGNEGDEVNIKTLESLLAEYAELPEMLLKENEQSSPATFTEEIVGDADVDNTPFIPTLPFFPETTEVKEDILGREFFAYDRDKATGNIRWLNEDGYKNINLGGKGPLHNFPVLSVDPKYCDRVAHVILVRHTPTANHDQSKDNLVEFRSPINEHGLAVFDHLVIKNTSSGDYFFRYEIFFSPQDCRPVIVLGHPFKVDHNPSRPHVNVNAFVFEDFNPKELVIGRPHGKIVVTGLFPQNQEFYKVQLNDEPPLPGKKVKKTLQFNLPRVNVACSKRVSIINTLMNRRDTHAIPLRYIEATRSDKSPVMVLSPQQGDQHFENPNSPKRSRDINDFPDVFRKMKRSDVQDILWTLRCMKKDPEEHTLLQWFVIMKQDHLFFHVLEMLPNLDVNQENGNNSTILHFLAIVGSVEMVDAIMKRGGDLTIRNFDNETPVDVSSTVPGNALEIWMTQHGMTAPRTSPVMEPSVIPMEVSSTSAIPMEVSSTSVDASRAASEKRNQDESRKKTKEQKKKKPINLSDVYHIVKHKWSMMSKEMLASIPASVSEKKPATRAARKAAHSTASSSHPSPEDQDAMARISSDPAEIKSHYFEEITNPIFERAHQKIPIRLIISSSGMKQKNILNRMGQVLGNSKLGYMEIALQVGNVVLKWDLTSLVVLTPSRRYDAVGVLATIDLGPIDLQHFNQSQLDDLCHTIAHWNGYKNFSHINTSLKFCEKVIAILEIKSKTPGKITRFIRSLEKLGNEINPEISMEFHGEEFTFRTHRELDEFCESHRKDIHQGSEDMRMLRAYDKVCWLRYYAAKQNGEQELQHQFVCCADADNSKCFFSDPQGSLKRMGDVNSGGIHLVEAEETYHEIQ